VLFYTHISDQYTPFYTKVIAANARDATHVLDGLLYHESDLRIEEHYTDTGGLPITSLHSAIFWDFASHRVFVTWPTSGSMYRARSAIIQTLAPLIGGKLNLKLVASKTSATVPADSTDRRRHHTLEHRVPGTRHRRPPRALLLEAIQRSTK